MSSMEEIIEIFADSISGFIMLSIKLQEQNTAPQQALRPAAEGVVQAAKILVQIAREKGTKEYGDYEEIQEDIFDCCDRVTQALDKFPSALSILFQDTDRAGGWRKLVQATQQIASQTSRLLLVVFGAEHRRLEMAGKLLLESCANVKRYAGMSDSQLQQQAKGLVEGTNKTSSDLMIFNSYVQARAKETEGPKQQQLQRAVGQFNTLNQDLVNNCNSLLKGIGQPTRNAYVRTVDEIARITREILDMLTPPEDLDIFKVIQDLYNKGSMAVMSQAKPLGSVLANPSGRDVTADDLFREGEEVKRALIPVRKHKTFPEKDDVANNTNVASAKVAKYNNLLADYIALDKQPALKSTLSSCHADMNGANEELVRTTNDYLSALGGEGLKAPSRSHATPARNAPGANAARMKPGVTDAAKRVVVATSKAVKAGGSRDAFVPAARDASEATKQLVAAVDALAAQCPADQAAELKRHCAAARGGVVNTVQNGKALLADPSNPAKAKPVQESGSSVARAVKALLDAVNRAGDSGGARSTPAASSGDLEAKSRAMNDACKRVEDIIDKVNDEINPKSTLATHAVINGPVSQAELDATAEEVLRRIRELRGYPSKTPKEITGDADTLSAVTAKFGKQLEARSRQVNPNLGRTLGDLARQIDPPANRAVVDAVNAYIPRPDRNAAQRVDGSCDELERLVRATMDAMKPKVEISTTRRAVPANVTPVHIRDAAEKMKADNRPVKDYANLAPADLARAVGDVHQDATHLGDMLDKYGGAVAQPALRSQLAQQSAALDDAKEALVHATDAYNQNPDDNGRKRDLEAAAQKIDELADDIIKTVLPAGLARAQNPNVGNVSNDDLERGGKELIAAENKLADFRDMTPEEVVAAANDASGKAATFAAQLGARSGQVPQAELKRMLADGARDIDRLNDEQHAAVRDHMEDPLDSGRAARLEDVGRRINERTQQLLDDLMPVAKKDRNHGPYTGHVAPKDIEREGRVGQQKADRVGEHGKLTPKQLVGEAEAAFQQIDKIEEMLKALAQQPETRPATKAAVSRAIDKLHDDADRLIDRTNDLIQKPEENSRARALEDEIAAIKRDIDQAIEDVKPKASVAQSRGGAGDNITPGDLHSLGKQVQAAARDVQAYKSQTPQETVAKTEKASGLAAKFADAVQDRAKHDNRPGVADMLRAAAPKVDAANKRMVEATNAYTADPANASAQREVDDATNELINVVQDVLDKLTPDPKMASSNPDWNKNVTMADIERNAKDLREAVKEVKKFPNKNPTDTCKDSEHASQKLVDFCDDLKVKARKLENPKARKVYEDCAERLMKRNPQLNNATKAYINNPDDPNTGEDLDGVCDLILADLDDIMKQINPTVAVGKGDFKGGKVSPEDLEALGEKVKQKVTVVEDFNNMAPAELAAAGNDACRTADDFKEALKARSNQVTNGKEKKALSDGADLIARRNDELAAATNAQLADPNDKAKQRELAQACQNMKDAVDEVLGRVRPHATLTDPNSVTVGPVKPSDLEVTCEEVIKAATDLQGFRDDSPEETRDKTNDTSRKAAKYAAQVKKLAEQTTQPEQKKRLMDAYRDLEDANKGVVDASNDYMGDPESSARQNELHEACENLKRAARAALDAARPKVDMGGEARTHNGPVGAQELKDAAEALKRALKPLKQPEQLTPEGVKDATEDTNRKALDFISLARAKANQTKDPTKKAALNRIVDEINAERSVLGNKANDYIGDNSANNARALAGSAQKIEDLVDKYMNEVKPKAKATEPGNTKRETDLESMDAAAEAAKKAVRRLDAGADTMQDDEELVEAADDASAKVARFNEHVNSLMQETEDKELKDKLRKALQDLNRDNKDLVAKTNNFISGDRDPAARAKLAEICSKTIRDIDHVMHDIRDAMKPKTFEDEIDEAALDIQEAVDEYAHVPPELRDLAMRLAELMRQLAECARNGDRPGIISTSKAISDIVKQIQKFAKPYGDQCKDPNLQDTVYVGVQAMGNFGTQLKILAAVKAGSSGPDPAAENQLVACCEGISAALRQTLFGVQSAKLRK